MVVRRKEDNKHFSVYKIRNDGNGYPQFLIYCEEEWRWISAKYFTPTIADWY